MGSVIVVGGGQAGASCVARLRTQGFDGQITLIGDEPEPPYQRPPLSKAYLLGDMDKARLYLRPASYYPENSIDLHLSAPVTAIDPATRQVRIGSQTLVYNDLVLCTGSVPRRLPVAIGGDLGGVFCVRTLADVDSMRPWFRTGARALIVGGGYIGLEAAAVCAKLGVKVTLLEMAPRILQRVASEQTSDYFRALHRDHGVDLREGVGLDRLLGETAVSGARLSDGTTIEVDLVIVGVGILPATTLASVAGLTIDNGIAVDAQGRSSDPHIWAAGDCASFPYGDTRLRLESVGNAIDMGELVADNIMGAGRDYVSRPWFWSDQYDVKLQIAGLSAGYTQVVVRGAGASRSHWYFNGSHLIALDAMNDPRAYMVGKRLIEGGKTADPATIADPETDLRALLQG